MNSFLLKFVLTLAMVLYIADGFNRLVQSRLIESRLCPTSTKVNEVGSRSGRRLPSTGLSMVQLYPRSQQLKTTYLFNTGSRTKEEFKPIDTSEENPEVSFYSCGPTVYDFAHIGNFRAFLTYDLLKRWLTYCGYNVKHICNLTDVDDKIIKKMQTESKSLAEITNTYSEAFFDDLDVLNIIKAERYPKATEHIGDIITMITGLIEKGVAYEKNGSVYFRVNAFASYGKLSNLKFDDMQDGAGGSGPNEKKGTEEKESVRDFALWKAFVDGDGEVVWDSPFGRGRPGWHIECSAMCNCLLGKTIDIHAGGVDLVFPHHENEVAQSEAFNEKTFCNYWIHNGFVNINNEKMSKSLKNFKTLRDIATTPFDARAFRFMVVTAQYRGQLNFTPDTLQSASNSLKRIDKVIKRMRDIIVGNDIANGEKKGNQEEETTLLQSTHEAVENFENGMSDDMNTPRASAAFFSVITNTEKYLKKSQLSKEAAEAIVQAIEHMDTVFGVLYEVPVAYFNEEAILADSIDKTIALPLGEVPPEVIELAEHRVKSKSEKDWAKADQLRESIAEAGFTIKDVKTGEIKYEFFRK